MKNIPLLVGTLIGTIVLIVAVAFFFSKSDTPTQKNVDSSLIYGDSRHAKGPTNAKVTIAEFSDFQCPACLAAEPTVRQIVSKYPNDVRLVYRQFPLVQIHKNAEQAALTAETAGTFGKFWEMHDMLFDNQSDWADLSSADLEKKFDTYLDKIQIDKNEFKKKIGTQEVHDLVAKDVSDGTKADVQGTPTFYVNGQETAAPDLVSTVESLLKAPQK